MSESTNTQLPAVTTPGGPAVVAGAVERPNFFKPVGVLMKSIPTALALPGPSGGAPRYVRIARLRPFLQPAVAEDAKLAGVIARGAGFFITGMAYVLKYTLKLQELLVQGDAGKALLDTALMFAKTVTEQEFLNGIEELSNNLLDGPVLSLAGPMAPVGTAIDTVQKYINYIPEPQDLEDIGRQLYSMLVIEWTAAPATPAAKKAETAPVDMVNTGKLRLLLWALNKPFEPLDTGITDLKDIKFLGQRRLWRAAAAELPASSTGTWKESETGGNGETIFSTTFTDAQPDVLELQRLLKAYGYPLANAKDGVFDDATKKGVEQFQELNELTVNGEVDLPTVNQLFHLRYAPAPAEGRLRKAKRYNAADLKTPV